MRVRAATRSRSAITRGIFGSTRAIAFGKAYRNPSTIWNAERSTYVQSAPTSQRPPLFPLRAKTFSSQPRYLGSLSLTKSRARRFAAAFWSS